MDMAIDVAKKSQIIVPYGAITQMSKDMGYSLETIKRALRFYTYSEVAIGIRQAAVDKYHGRLACMDAI